MQYKVMNRQNCERYALQKHKVTSVVISIRSTWDKVKPNIIVNQENGIQGVLFLAFDDIDLNTCIQFDNYDGLITGIQAEHIFKFCNKWYGKVDTFIFHCDGGISRSAGCCGAIMRWFEGYDYPIMGKKSKYPNMYCYLKVLDACRGIHYQKITSKGK